MLICTIYHLHPFVSENSVLSSVYFTLYPTLNEILLAYLLARPPARLHTMFRVQLRQPEQWHSSTL